MVAMDMILQVKVQNIVGEYFTVSKKKDEIVVFKNRTIDGHNYAISCNFLTEVQILEIAKILLEVYKGLDTNRFMQFGSYDDEPNVALNPNSMLADSLVSAVLDLRSSSDHKLLLLTSGSMIVSDDNADLVIKLVKMKHEVALGLKSFNRDNSFNLLREFYIFPGVNDSTTAFTAANYSSLSDRDYFESTVKLVAFLANHSKSLTLEEHLNVDFEKSAMTQGSLNGYERMSALLQFLDSSYKDMMLSMTAKELRIFSQILLQESPKSQYPETILRKRCAAIEYNDKRVNSVQKDSITRYMSNDERNLLAIPKFSETVDELISSRFIKANNPPIIYAALAEVCAARGESIVLEISREMEHLRNIRSHKRNIYVATVNLISESLKPENREFPFAWIAQLSEHAWVLTSHLKEKQVSLVV